MIARAPGVTYLVPVRDGGERLNDVFAAIFAQDYGGASEVVVVDDRSGAATERVLAGWAGRVRILDGGGRGVAAALNLGVAAASYELIAQVDQDVLLKPGWTARLVEALQPPDVAAAQGWFETDPAATLWARVMGRDLEDRYFRIAGNEVDQVCTGNSIYRRSAMVKVGGLCEALGYGADVDFSYRLQAAGFRLVFCREARSVHGWRPTLRGYLRQQYGFGYGRLGVLQRHPRYVVGDKVSATLMMMHAPLLALALGSLATAGVLRLAGVSSVLPLTLGGSVLAALIVERLVVGVRAALRFRDPAPLLFPFAHLLRDVAWLAAVAAWSARRLLGHAAHPGHSMSTASPVEPSPRHAAVSPDGGEGS